MTWVRANLDEAMGRLSYGDAPKGMPQPANPQAQAFAPGAPVRPVSEITSQTQGFGLGKAPAQQAPVWGSEAGWGQVTPAQTDYLNATQLPTETRQQLPLAAFNWSQSRPSVTRGLPTWANNLLNQSAYNTAGKEMNSVPQFAPNTGTAFRHDTQIEFPTTSREVSSHYNVPRNAQGNDWWGVVDTARPGWTNRNAARYEYRPNRGFGLGEFLMAAAPLIGGAMFGPSLLGGALGNAGTAASNAFSIASNARR